MGNIERSTWHDEFDRCPGCGHATVGLQRPWGIHHAAGCEVAEFIARTTSHPGAVDAERARIAAFVGREEGHLMSLIERFSAEFDRMPHYGAEGCLCGNVATPDRECPLHAANWIIERLQDDLRGAVEENKRLRSHPFDTPRESTEEERAAVGWTW